MQVSLHNIAQNLRVVALHLAVPFQEQVITDVHLVKMEH